jgi:nucleotide-binding universal stress UspA family protein
VSYELFLIAWVGLNLIFGTLTAYAASRWGRDPFRWLFAGAILGPFATILLLLERWRDPHTVRPVLKGPAPSGSNGGPRILVAVDGSDESKQAIEYVINNFGTGVGDVDLIAVAPIESADGLAAEEGSLKRRLLQEEVEHDLENARRILHDAGIPNEYVVRFGDPASEIIAQAQETHRDVIVLGRRGRGKAVKFLLGSVSEKVTKRAPCPVTVVG